jgi:hypothetical protein
VEVAPANKRIAIHNGNFFAAWMELIYYGRTLGNLSGNTIANIVYEQIDNSINDTTAKWDHVGSSQGAWSSSWLSMI